MNRSERAYVRRLEKRCDSLRVALCIIKTWLSFPRDAQLLYSIGKLCAEKIEEDDAAIRKEAARKGADA